MKAAAVLGPGSMLGSAIMGRLSDLGVPVVRIGRSADMDIRLDLDAGPSPDGGKGLHADVLFHCAAAFGGNDAHGLQQNLRVNVASCASVLGVAATLGCRQLVYAGSAFSYDGADPEGMGAYGLSKALAEQALSWGMSRAGGRFCSLRLAQLYDTAGRCCRHQPWFGRIVGHAARGLDLRMPEGECTRNFVHVDDAARLMVDAASQALSGTWAVCSDESPSPRSLAELAYQTFGRGGVVVTDPAKTPFRPFRFPAASPVFEALGAPRCRSLEDGLQAIRQAGTGEAFGPVGDT